MSKICYAFNSASEANAKIVQCWIALLGSAYTAFHYYQEGDLSHAKACAAVCGLSIILLGVCIDQAHICFDDMYQ